MGQKGLTENDPLQIQCEMGQKGLTENDTRQMECEMGQTERVNGKQHPPNPM